MLELNYNIWTLLLLPVDAALVYTLLREVIKVAVGKPWMPVKK